MLLEKRIDHLIRTASDRLKSDIFRDSSRTVSKQALHCIEAIVGSDHPYADLLRDAADGTERSGLLIACGVLWAAKLLEADDIPLETDRADSVGSRRE